MRQDAAAAYLGVEPRTLEQWRHRRCGPAFVKLGKKVIRYRRDDLDRWIAERRVDPAAGGGVGA